METGPFIVATGGIPKWEPEAADQPGREDFSASLKSHGLEMIGMIHSCGYPVDGRKPVEEHLASLEKQAVVAKAMGSVLINVHGGRDAWDVEAAVGLIAGVAELEAKLGVPFVFETHRQRLFWNPWQTRDIIMACDRAKIPVKINADLSHWCAGGERIFDDVLDPEFGEILSLVADRASLVHARVG